MRGVAQRPRLIDKSADPYRGMQLRGRWNFSWGLVACAGFFGVVLPMIVRRRWLRLKVRARKVRRRCEHKEMLAQVPSVCLRYGLSPRGFLPSFCLERLPDEFQRWEDLADRLVELNRNGGLKQAVDTLPHIDPQCLEGAGKEVLQRAFLLLGAFAHSYIHGSAVPWYQLKQSGDHVERDGPGPSGSAPTLPSQLAEPWLQVCAQLGMPPVLTAAATDLWNWRLRDSSGPFVLENLDQRVSLTGTSTERAFHMVPCAMQAAASKVVPKVFLADLLVRADCDEELGDLLLEVADVLRQFQRLFQQIPGSVDKDVFYDVYRPLLNGFHPDGVILEVSPRRVDKSLACSVPHVTNLDQTGFLNSSKGPSAGQSTVILLLDVFLAISHTGPGVTFQEEMLTYMPAEHRQMVLDFRQRWQDLDPLPTLLERKRTARNPFAEHLQEAYDECVGVLCGLRRLHLSTVTTYLVRTSTGTGATTWRTLLQNMLSATSVR
ncbi:Ido1 [Symbiodinium natans]|uniref:Ido1 protein n=1 Tax=Symbiodinium natans TaxID=878477 RepID=A0A812N9A3_9DINO|nr:Ido1 [Symbiodinium natans]